MGMDRTELAGRIAELALLRGTFTLRSGRTSSYYLDKYLFSTRPEVLRELGELFAARIGEVERATGKKTKRLAGGELGGIPLVTAASLAAGRGRWARCRGWREGGTRNTAQRKGGRAVPRRWVGGLVGGLELLHPLDQLDPLLGRQFGHDREHQEGLLGLGRVVAVGLDEP